MRIGIASVPNGIGGIGNGIANVRIGGRGMWEGRTDALLGVVNAANLGCSL